MEYQISTLYYREYNGVFELETLEMIEGDLPQRAIKMIKEWGRIYQNDLSEIWTSQRFKQLPGLE